MRPRRVTRKDILFLSISFFAVVVAWIGFNLYHTWVTSTISSDLQMQITPIDPTSDVAAINTLKQRKKIVPLFDNQNPTASTEAELSLTPTPTINPLLLFPSPPTEEVVPSEEPIPTEEPTPTL